MKKQTSIPVALSAQALHMIELGANALETSSVASTFWPENSAVVVFCVVWGIKWHISVMGTRSNPRLIYPLTFWKLMSILSFIGVIYMQ